MVFFFNVPHACVLLLLTWLGQDVLAATTGMAGTHRVLRAATRRGDMYKRSMRITKKFEAEVGYAEEENGWSGVFTFASQVKVGSQKPILNLEEVEHHLQDVQCGDGKMEISFVDKVSARDAYHACHESGGGLVITSHDSCNVEGERAVYRVHDVSFTSDGEALELDITEASWQDAFDKFDIAFGHTADDHVFRRHSDFAKIRKRQSFNVEIPADTPDSVTTGTFDLSSELIDKTFAAEDFLLGLEQLVPIPTLPIEFGCRNCSTRGQIALSQGAIQIDVGQIDLIPDIFEGGDDDKEVTSVVTGGFIELSATGVGARLELFARPKASGAFEIALFPLPILGFAIPGIGKAGAVFEPRIAFDFEISGGFELNYGIDVTIPDNSKIKLELTNIANSGINGFPETSLTPLPFQANITDVEILLGLAFKPTIPIGFEFTDKLTAEVSVSMNLPRLTAKLSTNPAANCGNNSTNSTTPSAPYANETTALNPDLLALGALTLVEANVSVTIDVGLGLTLPLLPAPFGNVSAEQNLFSTVFPLITACVDAGKTLPPMTPKAEYNKTMPTGKPIEGNATTVYVLSTTKTLVNTASASASSKGHVTSHVVQSSVAHMTLSAGTGGYGVVTSHVIASSVAHVSVPSAHASVVTPVSKQSEITASSRHFTNSTHATSIAVPVLSATLNSTATPAWSTQGGVLAPLASTRVIEAVQPAPTVVETPGFLNGTGGVPIRQTAPVAFTGGAARGSEQLEARWKAVGVLAMSILLGAMVL